MKDRHFLLRFLNTINRESLRINKIKSSEEKRAKSTFYGVGSLIYSAVMVASSSLLFLMDSISFSNNPLLAVFLLLFVIIAAIILPLLAAIYSLSYAIIQLNINKKPLGWIALLLYLIALVPTVLIVLAALNQ